MADHRLRLWLMALDRFELRLRANAARTRNAMIRKAASVYAGGVDLPSYVFVEHRKRVETTLADHYRRVIPYFAQVTLAQVKSRRIETKAAQDIYQALTAEWISREALRKARMIADTDRDDVMAAITRGLEEGLGTADIARGIRKVSSLTPARASTIARTETHQAATYASATAADQAQEQFGVRLLKEWLPTLDSRTRPAHQAMANSPPIPLNEKFVVGGELMDRPGDPSASAENVIACRCSIAFSEATNE